MGSEVVMMDDDRLAVWVPASAVGVPDGTHHYVGSLTRPQAAELCELLTNRLNRPVDDREE